MHSYAPLDDDDHQDLQWKDEGIPTPKEKGRGVHVRIVVEAFLLVLLVIALSIQLLIRTTERPPGPNNTLKDCEFEGPQRSVRVGLH